jgi:hypothetical protein
LDVQEEGIHQDLGFPASRHPSGECGWSDLVAGSIQCHVRT